MKRKYVSKYIECEKCQAQIKKTQKKCPKCGHIRYKRVYEEQNVPRNEDLVKVLNSGEFTLRDVGKQFGISGERARQIYKRVTGNSYEARLIKKKEIREKLKLETEEAVKFYCKGCGKPIKNKENNHKVKYCDECSKKADKNNLYLDRWVKCEYCKNDFHPRRNYQSPSQSYKKHIFCGLKCYFNFIRENKKNENNQKETEK